MACGSKAHVRSSKFPTASRLLLRIQVAFGLAASSENSATTRPTFRAISVSPDRSLLAPSDDPSSNLLYQRVCLPLHGRVYVLSPTFLNCFYYPQRPLIPWWFRTHNYRPNRSSRTSLPIQHENSHVGFGMRNRRTDPMR